MNLKFTNAPGKGWALPGVVSPTITSLSNYYSPAGAKVLVVIHGSNFQPYSSVKFATFKPTTYFISSNQIEFYVPNTVTAGIYPIEVYNNKLSSGPVLYTLDNSSGDWWRNNTAGAFYVAAGHEVIKPLTLIRYSVIYAGTTYRRFYGIVESFKHDWLDL